MIAYSYYAALGWDLRFNAFAAFIEIEAQDNYTEDNGHLVGFTDGLDYNFHHF